MSERRAAYRYAKAFMDLAIEQKKTGKVYEDMGLILSTIEDNDDEGLDYDEEDAGGIELTPVEQFVFPVEQIEVGRAGSIISFRNGLGLVIQIRKVEAELVRQCRHLLGSVLWIGVNVIGADRHHAKAFRRQLVGQLSKYVLYVYHVGAVVADKRDEQRFAGEGRQADVGATPGVRQRKGRGGCAQG